MSPIRTLFIVAVWARRIPPGVCTSALTPNFNCRALTALSHINTKSVAPESSVPRTFTAPFKMSATSNALTFLATQTVCAGAEKLGKLPIPMPPTTAILDIFRQRIESSFSSGTRWWCPSQPHRDYDQCDDLRDVWRRAPSMDTLRDALSCEKSERAKKDAGHKVGSGDSLIVSAIRYVVRDLPPVLLMSTPTNPRAISSSSSASSRRAGV
jgi:hypothetical protein